MRVWQIVDDRGVDGLALSEQDILNPGPHQVVIRVQASSLNYRDLSTVENAASRGLALPLVPNSDGAGEIVAVGTEVEKFVEGDLVSSCFFEAWTAGEITPAAMATALGGAHQGVLAEYVVLDQDGVIPVPAGYSAAQASTLPCAALTAWHALTEPYQVAPGDTVLLLGTGGVSVFAQQFCAMMGAKTIVTSSSDEKLSRMRDLGAGHTINYRADADWESTVMDMTDGRGVDRVVEVGGPGTLGKSIAAVRVGGVIALIGILTGAAGAVSPTDLMRKSITLRGIYVGSREMFEQMNRAIEHHGMRPIIDLHVPFDQAQEAYRTMRAATHFGKIVVNV